eukprot:EG_transcript_17468
MMQANPLAAAGWGAAAAPAAGAWGAATPAGARGAPAAANGGAWGAGYGAGYGAAPGGYGAAAGGYGAAAGGYGAAAAPAAGGWGGDAWGGGKGGKGGKGGFGGNRFTPYVKKGGPTTSVKLQPVPEGIGEPEIREVFAPFGEIQSVRIMPGTPNYAYVNYTTTSAAAGAIALNSIEMAGTKVLVNPGRPKYPDASDSIGLFNVPYSTTQEEIEKLVTQHAGFKKLKMILKPGTTEFRGFCFVEFESVDNAIAALEALQGTWIGNKAIDIKFATPAGAQGQGWGKGGGKGGFGAQPQWGAGAAGAWGAQPAAMWGQQQQQGWGY